MRELIERLMSEGVKTAKLSGALRKYAVVDYKTGKLLALVDAATFSQVGLNWVPTNLGFGEYLVFSPPKMLDGTPQSAAFKDWWRPTWYEVIDRGDGKWKAYQNRSEPGDERMAPKGYRKSDGQE